MSLPKGGRGESVAVTPLGPLAERDAHVTATCPSFSQGSFQSWAQGGEEELKREGRGREGKLIRLDQTGINMVILVSRDTKYVLA